MLCLKEKNNYNNQKKFIVLVNLNFQFFMEEEFGKTTLLTEFPKKHNCLYFLVQEKN